MPKQLDTSCTCKIRVQSEDFFDFVDLLLRHWAESSYLRGHAKAWPDRRLVRNDRSSVKWSIRCALESYIIPMSKGVATIPQIPPCGMFRKRSLRHLSEWHLSESHLSEPFTICCFVTELSPLTWGVMLRHDRTEGWLEMIGAVSSDP